MFIGSSSLSCISGLYSRGSSSRDCARSAVKRGPLNKIADHSGVNVCPDDVDLVPFVDVHNPGVPVIEDNTVVTDRGLTIGLLSLELDRNPATSDDGLEDADEEDFTGDQDAVDVVKRRVTECLQSPVVSRQWHALESGVGVGDGPVNLLFTVILEELGRVSTERLEEAFDLFDGEVADRSRAWAFGVRLRDGKRGNGEGS